MELWGLEWKVLLSSCLSLQPQAQLLESNRSSSRQKFHVYYLPSLGTLILRKVTSAFMVCMSARLFEESKKMKTLAMK